MQQRRRRGSTSSPLAPAVLTSLVVSPVSTTFPMPQGEAQQFEVSGLDQYGAPIALGATPVWEEVHSVDINAHASVFERWNTRDLVGVATPGATVQNFTGVKGRIQTQATSANRPTFLLEDFPERNMLDVPCLSFDSADWMRCIFPSGVLSPPHTMYFVVRKDTWVSNARIFEAHNGAAHGVLLQHTASPRLGFPITDSAADSPTLGEWCIITRQVNGASSFIQVNNLTPKVGTIGAETPTGLVMNAESSGPTPGGVAKWRDWVVCSGAHDVATRTAFKNRLAWEWGILI